MKVRRKAEAARQIEPADLETRYRNETEHARHVAFLGLALFDQTHDKLKIPLADRPLLQAACRFHDIGFDVNPTDHARESARIIKSHRILGLTDNQRSIVAAAVLLHGLNYAPLLKDRLFTAVRNRKRTLRLAAFLRVADALDRGHIQDSRIKSVDFRNGCFHVRVRSDGYWGNVRRAEQKADLWRKILPLGVKFVQTPLPSRLRPFDGVVTKDDTILSGARRILCLQCSIMRDAAADILAGNDPKHLHDMRVAMNRCRAAMRLFRNAVAESSATELARSLSEFRSGLGAPRDMQVWSEFLRSTRITSICADEPGWNEYLSEQDRQTVTLIAALRNMIESREYGNLTAQFAVFLRSELPRLADVSPRKPLAPFLARELLAQCKRLWSAKNVSSAMPAEDLHRIRKRCKRLRYWTEFAVPVVGGVASRLAKQLKTITAVLGDVHDMDVHLAAHEPARPAALDIHMASFRKSVLVDFEIAWRTFTEKGFRKRIERGLKAGTKK